MPVTLLRNINELRYRKPRKRLQAISPTNRHLETHRKRRVQAVGQKHNKVAWQLKMALSEFVQKDPEGGLAVLAAGQVAH